MEHSTLYTEIHDNEVSIIAVVAAQIRIAFILLLYNVW